MSLLRFDKELDIWFNTKIQVLKVELDRYIEKKCQDTLRTEVDQRIKAEWRLATDSCYNMIKSELLGEDGRGQRVLRKTLEHEARALVNKVGGGLVGLAGDIHRLRTSFNEERKRTGRRVDANEKAIAKLRKNPEVVPGNAAQQNTALPPADAKRIAMLEMAVSELSQASKTLNQDNKTLVKRCNVLAAQNDHLTELVKSLIEQNKAIAQQLPQADSVAAHSLAPEQG